MRHFAHLATLASVVSASLYGCGTKVLCGEGTVQVDNECRAVATTNPIEDASVKPVDDVAVHRDALGPSEASDALFDISVQPVVDASIVYRPVFDGVTSVAPASASALALAWKPALDPQTPQNQLVYRVYAGTAAGKEDFTTPKLVTPAGATSALITGLSTGVDTYFVVRAVNRAMLEDANTVEQHAKPEVDITPPNFDGAFTATTVGAASVKLEWAAAADDKTPTSGIVYAAYWATTPSDVSAGNGTFGGISEPGATSMIVNRLPKATTTYYFRIEARDASGNALRNQHSASAKTSADGTAPVFGGCVQTVNPSAGGVKITWAPASDDSTDTSALVYNVYASKTSFDNDGGGFDFSKPTASFKDGVLNGRVGGLTKESQYYFICRAEDQEGNEDTNTVQVSAITGKDSAPPSFGGVTSATLKGNVATLTWMPASDDQTPADSIRYLVFEGNASEAEDTSVPVARSEPGVTSFVLPKKLTPGTVYYWVVRASDEAGNLDANHVERGVVTPNIICFDTDILPIIRQNCAVVGCHTGDLAPQGLNMADAFAFDNLVNVAAVEDQPATADGGGFFTDGGHVYLRRKRIKPPDPNLPAPDESYAKESYLYLKITSDPDILGSAMPPTPKPALEGKEVGLIRNWILQGARRSCN